MAAKKKQEEEELKDLMDPWAQKEREVMLAEIENRLRDMILKILKPSLEKASNISGQIEDLKVTVYRHDESLNEVEILKTQVSQQAELTKLFEGEMEKLSQFNRSLEERIMKEQQSARSDMREMKNSLDKKSATITQVVREAERLWEEAQRLQKQHEDHKKLGDDRYDQQRTDLAHQKDELMETIFDLQTKHSCLEEDVWSDNHGLKHLADEIRKVNLTLEQLPQVQADIRKQDDTQVQMDKKMDGCEKYVTKTIKDMEALRLMFEEDISSVRGEFRELSSTLSAHHASLAKGIRDSYKEELKHAASLRADASKFMTHTDERCAEIEKQMTSADKQMQNLHKEIVKDIEEVNRKRKRDRLSLDDSIKDSGKVINGFKDRFDSFYRGMEHIAGVINIMLEGERVENALSIQDYVDRRQMPHLVCKGDLDQPLKAELGIQGLMNVCHKSTPANDGSVDVRKGFRKASYVPGPVSYGEANYERHDLLLIRDKLLLKAIEALRNGPDAKVFSRRFADDRAKIKEIEKGKDMDMKPPHSKEEKRGSVHGFGQRPGSQQQPHAGGSRGHAHGGLNDSPPEKGNLKLPLIPDNGMVTGLQPKDDGDHRKAYGKALTAR